MKYLILFLVGGLAIGCNNVDSPAAGNTNQDSVKQAAMSDSANFTSIEWIDSMTQDLNKVKEGQVLEISWKFRNSGNKPLVIANVRPGCGCTGAEGPKDPVAPGQEGVIKAQFNTEHYPGTQYKQVYVRSNTRNRSGGEEEVLNFKVEVEPKK